MSFEHLYYLKLCHLWSCVTEPHIERYAVNLFIPSDVVVMRHSRTAYRAGLTVNRVLLGQSTWDATWDAVDYSWGRQSQFGWKLGPFIMASVNPSPAKKKHNNYSTAMINPPPHLPSDRNRKLRIGTWSCAAPHKQERHLEGAWGEGISPPDFKNSDFFCFCTQHFFSFIFCPSLGSRSKLRPSWKKLKWRPCIRLFRLVVHYYLLTINVVKFKN